MNINHFTKPKALITLSAALLLMIDPNLILELLGARLEAAGVMMTRILGGAYLVSGIGIWSMASPPDVSTREAGLYALGETVAAAAVFIAASSGALNMLSWGLAFAYVLFACGFIFVALETRKAKV